MKHRIPIIALSLLMTSCLPAETTTKPATKPAHATAAQPGLQQRVEEIIRRRQCAENLRKIGEGLRQYANDDADPVPWTLTNPVFLNPTTKPATKPVDRPTATTTEANTKTQDDLKRKKTLVAAAKSAGKGQYRNLLETLADKADSLDACYDTLTKTMLEGRYEAVQAALMPRDKAGKYVFPDYRFAKLRARNEGASYWRYRHIAAQKASANSRQAAEFRRLAKSCTNAYEEAFRLAPSRFEKMCLYARWHELHADRRYEADSKLMRSGSPLVQPASSIAPQLTRQVETIRTAVTEGLKGVQLKKLLTAEAQTRFVEVFTDEYRKLARVGAPESVFKELIRDIPSFLTTAVHEAVLRDAEKQRLTIRFYLWQAIAGPRPRRAEREVIAEQIDRIAKIMQAKFDDAVPIHELLPDGVHTAERFRKAFRKYRDNRFVTYYKRALWHHEWTLAPNKYGKSMADKIDFEANRIAKAVREDFDEWDNKSGKRRWPNELEGKQKGVGHWANTFYYVSLLAYASWQRPILYQQPPGMRINGSSATVNHYGIWVFTLGRRELIPAYPWKKIISDVESCTSSAEKAAKEFLKAIQDGGVQKVKNLITEAPPHWTKEKMPGLVKEFRDEVYARNPQRLTNIRETALKGLWKWAAVRVEGPKGPDGQYLLVILKYVKINDRNWKWRVRLVDNSGPNVPPPPLKTLLEKHVVRITGKTSAPAVGPTVMAILKRLEAAGSKYPNITAGIDFKVDMLQTGDTEERAGKVYYQGLGEKESAKFRIHFDTLRQGTGPKIKDVVDYAFDGTWLTVRKERIKQMSRYQVAPPGKKINPLQLGKGPFPVPFGQKATTVIKHFKPTTRPAVKTDPKDTDYIKLTTRRRYRKDFSVVWLEMWVDRKSGLPVKIVAEDRSEDRTTVLFKETKTPKSFDKKTFALPRPPAGWEYHVEKFKGQVKP